MIRVGRVPNASSKLSYPGFTSIYCLTASTKYASLSPYLLKDERGRIMENIWQFSKVYPNVPASTQRYSQWQPRVIWSHPAEAHVVQVNGQAMIQPAYFQWRAKGMSAPDAIRYPIGYKDRHTCICSLAEDNNGQVITQPLSYIQARKQIYLPVYDKLVRRQNQFTELQQRLAQGENLLILEVDGPRSQSLDYYMEKYDVPSDWIDGQTVLATQTNLKILLNDDQHPFGHGYCLSASLQDLSLV